MTAQGVKRKLSAILSADVEGYSRLMGEDEEATVLTLTAYREIISSLVQQYRGRVVDSPGDNLLAEFISVVDAVQCAVEIQQVLKAKNEELPENRKMKFRIGINLGDVIEEGERIYGDGVNIAARVEGLANGGGICISGSAHEQIKNKLALGYEYLGEHTVKNIAEPVRVYKAQIEPEAQKKEKKPRLKRWQWAAISLVVLGAGAMVIWHFYFRPPPIEPADPKKLAYPLPEKPSIAVLPFANMSGDPEQEYIADGITENITTALSKIKEMFVMARTSTMTYKDKPATVKQVSEELGVRYVLEGSILKEGDRVRVTAQLVDAIKGHHLWAERYDRDTKRFFGLLDEITEKIVTALQVQLTWGDYARTIASTDNYEAWTYFNQGLGHYRLRTRRDNLKARELCERAAKLDLTYVPPLRIIARTHLWDVQRGWSESSRQSMKDAIECAQKALAIDESDPGVHTLFSVIYHLKGQYEKAIAAAERAIALDPNSPMGYNQLSWMMHWAGRFEESIELKKKAIRLHGPYFPAPLLAALGNSLWMAGHCEEALEAYKKLQERSLRGEYPKAGVHVRLAAAYICLGEVEEARKHAAEALRINPRFSLERTRKRLSLRNPADTERWIDALRKAGIPEKTPSTDYR